jgi:hypothetical protein
MAPSATRCGDKPGLMVTLEFQIIQQRRFGQVTFGYIRCDEDLHHRAKSQVVA